MKKRVLKRSLLASYLALGAVFAAGYPEIRFAHRWVEIKLIEIERPRLSIERVERLRASATDLGRLRIEFEVSDSQGEHFAFDVQSQALELTNWDGIRLQLGPEIFEVGKLVQAVDADGRVAAQATPLSAEARHDALLILLVEGSNGYWMLNASTPPARDEESEDAPGRESLFLNYIRIPIAPPITADSRRNRDLAAWVLRPLAFAVDAVTYPVQVVVFMYAILTTDWSH